MPFMNKTILSSLIALLPFFSACEKMADVGSPSIYSKGSLSFSYPGNWYVESEEKFGGPNDDSSLISLQSPGNANVTICFYDFEDDETLMEFATELSRDMASEIEDTIPLSKVGKIEFSKVTREGVSGPIEGLSNKIPLVFLGQKVPQVLEYFTLKKQSKTVFIVCQSSEEDLEKTEPAFKQIVETFELK